MHWNTHTHRTPRHTHTHTHTHTHRGTATRAPSAGLRQNCFSRGPPPPLCYHLAQSPPSFLLPLSLCLAPCISCESLVHAVKTLTNNQSKKEMETLIRANLWMITQETVSHLWGLFERNKGERWYRCDFGGEGFIQLSIHLFNIFLIFTFGHAMWYVASQFPDQGSNLQPLH